MAAEFGKENQQHHQAEEHQEDPNSNKSDFVEAEEIQQEEE